MFGTKTKSSNASYRSGRQRSPGNAPGNPITVTSPATSNAIATVMH